MRTHSLGISSPHPRGSSGAEFGAALALVEVAVRRVRTAGVRGPGARARGSSQPRDRTHVLVHYWWILYY